MRSFAAVLRRRGALFIGNIPVGIKLVTLLILSLFLFFSANIYIIFALCAVSVLSYPAAGFTVRQSCRMMLPPLVLALLLAMFQCFIATSGDAVFAGMRLFTLLNFAAFVSRTTQASAMMAATEHFFQRFTALGVNPRAIALALALLLRFVPLINHCRQELQEAQKARCGSGRLRFFGFAPFVLALLLRLASAHIAAADALAARGFDD